MMVTGTPGCPVGCAPGMLLIGVGGGMLFMPLILTATASVAPKDAGVTSGVISTSQQLGGALGLAILAILATSQTHHLQASRAPLDALNSGFHLAFLIGGPGERRCAGPRSARTIPGVGSVVLSSAACWRCCWSTRDKSCPLSVCSTSCGAKRRPRRRETSRQRLVSRMRHALDVAGAVRRGWFPALPDTCSGSPPASLICTSSSGWSRREARPTMLGIWRERLRGQQMLALHRSGRQAPTSDERARSERVTRAWRRRRRRACGRQ